MIDTLPTEHIAEDQLHVSLLRRYSGDIWTQDNIHVWRSNTGTNGIHVVPTGTGVFVTLQYSTVANYLLYVANCAYYATGRGRCYIHTNINEKYIHTYTNC